MIEVVTLIERRKVKSGTEYVESEVQRNVFARLTSIGMQEFYQSAAVGMKPEIKFILADVLDYGGETELIFDGNRYSVIRTFRTGKALEIVCQQKVGA